MKAKISSPNLSKVVGGIRALINGIPISAKTSSKRIAEEVLQESLTVPPMAPKDTNALRETARVEPVKQGYAVVYGGKTPSGKFVDYAAYVHDDLRPNLKYKLPGSGPKFVETHMLRKAQSAPAKFGAILEELAENILRTYR